MASTGRRDRREGWRQGGDRKKQERRDDTSQLVGLGAFHHAVKDTDLVVIKLSNGIIPHFSAGIYAGGTRRVASVDEIFGKFDDEVFMSIKMDPGMKQGSFKKGDTFCADAKRCLEFEKIKGASKMERAEEEKPRKRAALPHPHDPSRPKHGRSSKFRTHAANSRIKAYAEQQSRARPFKRRPANRITKFTD